MERKRLSPGLVWREKPGGGFYPYIHFKKMHRRHYIRGSSKTTEPEEAARQLRAKIGEIDALEVYGVRPKRTFREGAEKLIREADVRPNGKYVSNANSRFIRVKRPPRTVCNMLLDANTKLGYCASMKTKTPKIAKDKSEIVSHLPKACSDETAAVLFLEAQRWGDHPACPHCGSVDVYQMQDRTGGRNKRFLWKCKEKECGKQYTVRVGTVFEDSLIPLRHWCFAFWAACSSKKGVSAMQIKRQTGLSYKSALFMMHRIRYAMSDDHTNPAPLTGIVEVDETYVGGKPRVRDARNRGRRAHKPAVAAIVQRGGSVRARVMPEVNGNNLKAMIRENVHKSARIVTDEAGYYRGLKNEYEGGHDTINHSAGVYAIGDVTTNTVEGFFSILKRGINGVYHSVSKKHLHRYLSEFEYRYNTRTLEDGERTVLAIRKADGKRLLYKQPLSKTG